MRKLLFLSLVISIVGCRPNVTIEVPEETAHGQQPIDTIVSYYKKGMLDMYHSLDSQYWLVEKKTNRVVNAPAIPLNLKINQQ